MTNHTKSPKFSPEVRERAVRMVLDHAGDYPSQWAAIASIAAKIGCTAQTLSNWVKQAERDSGRRAGLTTDDRERLKQLERENKELRQANEILRVVVEPRSAWTRAHILRRRSSTAGRRHDEVHRRVPVSVRGRADLRAIADRPGDLL